ncbi:hypothetical protein Tco_0632992 [Tanacetum coccineum]
MICNMDFIVKYMLEIILHQRRTPQLLKQKKLMQTQEDHSNPIPAWNVDSLKVDLVVIQNTCSEKENSNSETTSNKSVKESSLDSATKDMQTQESKADTGKVVDADLVITKSSGTESKCEDTSNRVDQYPEKCQVKSPMLDSPPDNQTTDYPKPISQV